MIWYEQKIIIFRKERIIKRNIVWIQKYFVLKIKLNSSLEQK